MSISLIAATAFAHGLPFATANDKHKNGTVVIGQVLFEHGVDTGLRVGQVLHSAHA